MNVAPALSLAAFIGAAAGLTWLASRISGVTIKARLDTSFDRADTLILRLRSAADTLESDVERIEAEFKEVREGATDAGQNIPGEAGNATANKLHKAIALAETTALFEDRRRRFWHKFMTWLIGALTGLATGIAASWLFAHATISFS